MAKNDAENNKIQETAPKKQPGLIQLVVAGLLVFLLGGGLVIGYFQIVGVPGQEKAAKEKDKKEEAPTATLELGTIIVNLADPGANRFLKTEIVLEHPEKETFAEELNEKKPEIIDLVTTILRGKTVEEIQPLDKYTSLKNEIKRNINARLDEGKVSRIFFTEFIIQ